MDRPARSARVLTVLAATVGFLLLLTSEASAHAELVETNPSNGAHLDRPPREVLLRFSEAVSPVRGGFGLLDGSGKTISQAAARGVPGDAALVGMPLPESLGDGVYVVTWRVVSADSHPIHGALVFSVGTARAAPLADAGAKAGSDSGIGLAFWVFRLFGFVSLALLVGGTFFLVACWPAGRADQRTRRLLTTAWIAAITSAAAVLILQGPNVAGSSLAAVVDLTLVSDTVGTSYGVLLLTRIMLLVLAGLLLRRVMRAPEAENSLPRRQIIPFAVIGTALALTWSGTGHATAGTLAPAALIIDAAHLAAMAIWLGGLAVLSTCALRARGRSGEDEAASAVARFSRVAGVAVAVLGTTGLLQAWRELAAFGPGTQYFTLLIFKIAAFGLLLWLAALSRSAVMRKLSSAKAVSKKANRLGQQEMLTRLRHSVRWEAGIAVAVLGLTAALVAIPPGGHDHGPSVAAAQPAGPFLSALALPGSGDVQVWVDPARTGNNQIVLNVRDGRGINRDVPEVRAQLRLPAGNIGPLPVALSRTGPGQFVANAVVVPVAGTWQLNLSVRTTDFDESTVDAQIPMR